MFFLYADRLLVDAFRLDVFIQAATEERVGDIKRVETSLRIDLQYLCLNFSCKVNIVKQLTGYIALVNITRCVEYSSLFIKGFVVPAPTTNRVTHVHIYYTPRSKHSLFIWIAEIRENLRNLTDALIYMHKVSLTGKGTIFLTRFLETGSIEALTNLVEIFFRDSLWHKLSPRLILNFSGEVVNSQFILRVTGISTTIHKQRNTERNTTDIGHTLL